jgi:maltooligosyltrehalose trehalohydrolase
MKWGPEKLAPGRWRFALWAPAVERPLLELDGRKPLAMEPQGEGWHASEAEAEPGTRYRFRVSPELAVPDPASRAQADEVHGWSLLVDPDSHQWRCADWRGRPWPETVVYELHAGLLGGFDGVAAELARLAELGVTVIELMPVAAFSGTRNWGYDGVLPYAPAAAYGSPNDLKALVDRAHELGLSMILDVVYNHFGPDGNYLGAYAPDFFDSDAQTPWGAAIAFERKPVRRFFIDNARMWLEEYRFDGLRFDAVHAISDRSFLEDLGRELRDCTRGRHVHLVLENEANEAPLLEGLYDAQWNDDFHNVAHVLLTGETQGYYGDFARQPARKLARCLEQGFIYQGEPSPGSGEPRGSPSAHLPAYRFISFLQNHDQIGNRAFGERLTLLTSKQRLRAATALLLLSPQIPLLFMGEETGSLSHFLFFTDFHDELADAVREGRRKEFARFEAFADPAAREKIPDPNAQETFARSRPQPGADGDEWLDLYRRLLALRHERIVPKLGNAKSSGAQAIGDAAVLAQWTLGDSARLTLFANIGEEKVEAPDLPRSEPMFALGKIGDSGSFSAWLEDL